MHLKNKLQSFFFLLVLSLILACEKSPTGPEPIKDPRTYTWTIETLAYPGSFQTSMYDIWASSPADVYVVGHNDRAFGKMFHFDGKRWRPVDLPFGHPDLTAIHGFDSKTIFVVGQRVYVNPAPPPNFLDSVLLLRYDGTAWRDEMLKASGILQAVWGSSPVDVWAGGTNGTLFYYNGSQWTRYPMPDSIWIASITGRSSRDVHAIAYTVGEFVLNIYYHLSWNGTRWQILESFKASVSEEDKFGTNKIVLLDGVLFSVGSGVFERTQAGWQRLYGDRFTGFRDLSGTHKTNFFAVGNYGLIVHYNGVDWKRLVPVKTVDIHYSGCWTDGREVFIVGNDGNKSYILHGK